MEKADFTWALYCDNAPKMRAILVLHAYNVQVIVLSIRAEQCVMYYIVQYTPSIHCLTFASATTTVFFFSFCIQYEF